MLRKKEETDSRMKGGESVKKLLRGKSGFTLVELMVVIAILSVLAAIVSGGVVGTKAGSELSQAKSDAANVQSTAQRFNNFSRTGLWPESAITFSTPNYTIASKTVTNTMLPSAMQTGLETSHTYVNWTAGTEVRQAGGGVATAYFVPDFINQKPDSTRLVRGTYDEYLWLLKKGTAFDEQGRSVQVFRLNADGTAYEKIYPVVD